MQDGQHSAADQWPKTTAVPGVFAVRGRPGQLTAEEGNYPAAERRAEDRGSHDQAECTAMLSGVAAAQCCTVPRRRA